MTTPRGPRFDETAPIVVVEPIARTAADVPAVLTVTITNTAPEPRIMSLTALGADASWLPRPTRSRPFMPGETAATEVTIRPAPGTLPARYPLALAVQALDPVAGQAMSPTTIANLTLIVDAPGLIEVDITPAEVSGRTSKKITVELHNAGIAADTVYLDAQSPETAKLELDTDRIEIDPGQTRRIRGRLSISTRLFGHPQRFTYTVTARGAGAPRRAQASVTTRAFLGASSTKAFVLIGIVLLWGAMALVFIPKLSSTIQNGSNKGSNVVGNAQGNAQNKATSEEPKGKGGSASGSPSGSGSATGSSSGHAAASSSSSKSSGSSPTATTAAATTVQLNGTVAGQSPSGVTVAIAPTSLVNEAAQSSTPVGVDAADFTELGKIPESALPLLSSSTSSSPPTLTAAQSRSTITGTDGAWSFGGVRNPGYYLVTFSKSGYQTQRYVIDSSSPAATQPLNVTLAPGQGSLSGKITGPGGAVGGASITISDGTNTITTSSLSKGAVGTWSVDGLSTPDSYLVSATKDGDSTESQLVSLGAGGVASVNLALHNGVATLSGTVTGPDSLGNVVGLGGVTITASDGNSTHTATTLTPVTTAGSTANLGGTYTIPNLPPGDYTVTASAPGYLSQTQSVTIKPGQATAQGNARLTSATAIVIGTVKSQATGDTVVGAGITLTSANNVYKITSGSQGMFTINGVAPATYVLTAQYFGLATGIVSVTAVAGQTTTVDVTDLDLPVESVTNTSTITGFAGNAASPGQTLTCPVGTNPGTTCVTTFSLTNSAGTEVDVQTDATATFGATTTTAPATTGPTGFTIYGELNGVIGLPPGLYHLTVTSTGFLPETVTVRVPKNAVASAPPIGLFPVNNVVGTIDMLGDPFLAGTTASSPYKLCVWAQPTNLSEPAPTTCSYTAPSTSTCQTKGQPEDGFTAITEPTGALGADVDNSFDYTVTGLCDGTYNIYAVSDNPRYVNPGTMVETLLHGQTGTFSPHIQRLGQIQVAINEYDPDTGVLTNPGHADLSGTITCGSISADLDTLDDTSHTVTVYGLAPGANLSCNASTDDSPSYAGHATGLATAYDTTTEATMTLFQAVTLPLYGQVVAPYGSSDHNPVTGYTLHLSGVTGFSGSTPTTTPVSVITDSNGCFAITADGTSDVSTTGGCGTISHTNTAALNVVNRNITVSASGGGVDAFNQSISFPGQSLVTITLTPAPIPSTPTIIGTNAGSIDRSTISVTVNSSIAHGAGTTVTASVNAVGQLQWNDSSLPANEVWPGSYSLTFSAPGYEDLTLTLTCNFNASSCTTSTSPQLIELASLSGNVIAYLQSSFTLTNGTAPSQPLPNAAVSLYQCTASESSTACQADTSDPVNLTFPTTDTHGNYTFSNPTDSSPYNLAPGQYHLRVTASGYDAKDTTINLSSGSNTSNVTMYETPVADYRIYLQSGTDANNNPLYYNCDAGTATPNCQGLLVQMRNTAFGGTSATGTYVDKTATAGAYWDFGQVSPGNYAVSIYGGIIESTFLSATIDLNTDITTGTSPPNTQSLTVPVTVIAGTVFGNVTGAQGQSGAVSALNGITVELGHFTTAGTTRTFVEDIGNGGEGLQTTTAASAAGVDGSWVITDVPSVPSTTYVVQFSGTGYATAAPLTSVFISGLQTDNYGSEQMTRLTQNVSVTVTSTAGSDDLSGATTATLTNVGDSTWHLTSATPTHTTNTVTWSFSAVPSGLGDFENWTLSFKIPDGHMGTVTATLSSPPTSCPATTGSTGVTCTATVTVPGDSTGSNPLALSYSLGEYAITATTTGTAMTYRTDDPSATSGTATYFGTPAPISLAVTQTGTTRTVYSGSSLAVPTSSPPISFWGANGATYTGTPALPSSDAYYSLNTATVVYSSSSPSTAVNVAAKSGTISFDVTCGTCVAGHTTTPTVELFSDSVSLSPRYFATLTATQVGTGLDWHAVFTDVPLNLLSSFSAMANAQTTSGTTTTNVACSASSLQFTFANLTFPSSGFYGLNMS
jgi:hypothetical protein